MAGGHSQPLSTDQVVVLGCSLAGADLRRQLYLRDGSEETVVSQDGFAESCISGTDPLTILSQGRIF